MERSIVGRNLDWHLAQLGAERCRLLCASALTIIVSMSPSIDEEERGFQVFFSWQSDIDIVRNAARDLIRQAVKQLEGKHGEKFSYTEATRNVPGAINIPIAILEAIAASDVFVADITTINQGQKCRRKHAYKYRLTPKNRRALKPRKTPNPNVVFELGFASALLGWERIILILDKVYGDLSDVPFDFRQHRILEISTDGTRSQLRKKYLAGVTNAIERIWNSKPVRVGVINSERAAYELDRDEKTTRRLLKVLDFRVLNSALDALPSQAPFAFMPAWDSFDGAYSKIENHLYNEELQASFKALHLSWGRVMGYSNHFFPHDGNADYYVFHNHRQLAHNSELVASLTGDVESFAESLRQVVRVVSKHFPVIDLEEGSLPTRAAI